MNAIKYTIAGVVSAILAGVLYYLTLPAMALGNPAMWFYFLIVGVILTAALWLAGYGEDFYVPAYVTGIISVCLLLVFLLGPLFSSKMFSSHNHYSRLEVEETTFKNEFSEVDWNTVPQIDKASSSILGNRKMGTLTDKVSQYNVLDEYTIINYSGKPVRVSPLGYAGFFKYTNNKINGIPGYIMVDNVSKDAKYVEIEEGMVYSPSSYFAKDLKRYLRNNFPSTMFGEFSFEIDDEGTPFWIIPTYKFKGMGGAKVPTGCITLNPVTGKLKFYELDEIPTWIDAALDPYIVVDMIDSWGSLADGFWNTIFGQQNVKESTEGYNYITINNDVYLYTGITSVVSDESNIGFILVNMRTAAAKYFELDSAEEYSAMDSAKGQVQHLNYTATFPILISVDGIPTYFLSLKDDAGLVKMYAFVSVQNIQQVSVTESTQGVEAAMNNYRKLISKGLNTTPGAEGSQQEIKVVVNEVYTAIIEGNSYYYIIAEDKLYVAPISVNQYLLPILKIGDNVTIKYLEFDGHNEITAIEKNKAVTTETIVSE